MFPADHVHPEFGYFCPSKSLRRKAWLAFTFINLCVIVGTLGLRAGHETDGERRLTLGPVDKSPRRSEEIPTVGQSTAMSAAETSRARERSACHEAIYFDGQCATDKVRRQVRPANDAPPIAAVALGRSALSVSEPPPPIFTAAAEDATIARGVTSGQTTAEGSTPDGATGRRAASPRKVRKVSANLNKGRYSDRWRGGIWSARAYAYSNDGYSRYQYTRSWGGSSW